MGGAAVGQANSDGTIDRYMHAHVHSVGGAAVGQANSDGTIDRYIYAHVHSVGGRASRRGSGDGTIDGWMDGTHPLLKLTDEVEGEALAFVGREGQEVLPRGVMHLHRAPVLVS